VFSHCLRALKEQAVLTHQGRRMHWLPTWCISPCNSCAACIVVASNTTSALSCGITTMQRTQREDVTHRADPALAWFTATPSSCSFKDANQLNLKHQTVSDVCGLSPSCTQQAHPAADPVRAVALGPLNAISDTIKLKQKQSQRCLTARSSLLQHPRVVPFQMPEEQQQLSWPAGSNFWPWPGWTRVFAART
jgi:hypothetical protein